MVLCASMEYVTRKKSLIMRNEKEFQFLCQRRNGIILAVDTQREQFNDATQNSLI